MTRKLVIFTGATTEFDGVTASYHSLRPLLVPN